MEHQCSMPNCVQFIIASLFSFFLKNTSSTGTTLEGNSYDAIVNSCLDCRELIFFFLYFILDEIENYEAFFL